MLESSVEVIDSVFRWDGWRAVAALGTFAAVVVALRRDGLSERAQRVRDAHLIGAILDHAEAAAADVKKFEESRKSKTALQAFFKQYENGPDVHHASDIFSKIAIKDCPNVEVMTTVGVLESISSMCVKRFDDAKSYLADHTGTWQPPAGTHHASVSFALCVKDLEKEQKLVAGPDYAFATQDGHRKERDKKLKVSARMQSLRMIPKIISSIVTNKAI